MSESTAAGEEWRPVVGLDGLYEVSDHGRVRSIERCVPINHPAQQTRRYPGKVLSPRPTTKWGHLGVHLSREHPRQVHRLVLEAFVGPCPPGMEGCHNNGDPADNRLTNLRWDTPSANRYDMVRHGRSHERAKTHCPRGHFLAEPNLRADAARDGHRGCLACNRAKALVFRRRKQGLILDMQMVADSYYADILSPSAA